MLPLHVYADAPVLKPAPKYPEHPLRVVVLLRRSMLHGRPTDGIVWLPKEEGLGPQRRDYVSTLLEADPQGNRLMRGLYAMANASGQGQVELGVIADSDETLFGPSLGDDGDPRTRPLCAALLHSASLRRPVDLVVVPHREHEPVNAVFLERLMRVAKRANVPMAVGVPASAVQMLLENQTFENSRGRDHAGWVALVAGDLRSPEGAAVPAGPVSAVFALASTIIGSMTRNDLPNFIGRTTGGKAEGFCHLAESPAAAPVFGEDTWVEFAAAGFVPIRMEADGALFFPAAPMVRRDGPWEREFPIANKSVVNDPWAHAHPDQLPWKIMLTRMLSVLREARDELLERDANANTAAIGSEMENWMGAYYATHGAVISPTVRARRPFSERSRIHVESTEQGDFVGITLFPHRASTPREIFLVSYAVLPRGPFVAES
jgi:hypothetical protein